jgi:hypothetical protein
LLAVLGCPRFSAGMMMIHIVGTVFSMMDYIKELDFHRNKIIGIT